MKVKNTNNPILTSIVIIVALNILFVLYDIKQLMYVSIIIGLSVIISSKIAFYVDKLWMGVAKLLSYVVPNIILTFLFYLFLYPLSIFSRIFRKKDLLHLKNNSKSLWTDHNVNFTKDYFKKTW